MTSRAGGEPVPAAGRSRVLVAGIGNIFLGDDAFGCEVVRSLENEPLPDGVRVVDYGIGGLHLAYDIAAGVDQLILVDAVADAGEPGAVVVIEVDLDEVATTTIDAHGMDPAAVVAAVRHLGSEPPPTLLVGCQPSNLEEGIGLTEIVAAAVEPARQAVLELIDTSLS